ncbi:MAG: hypothetical protein ACYCVD_03835 [Desulfitobacteriaceae bacterium]
MSFSALLVITRWTSGSTILIALESIITFGLLGGLGYALGTVLAFLLFAFLAERISKEWSTYGNWIGYWRVKLKPFGFMIVLLLGLFTSSGVLFMQEVAGAMVFQALSGVPAATGATVIFVLGVFMFSLPKSPWSRKLGLIQIALLFLVTIFLPINLFVRESVERIFNGVRLYHPYLLVTNYDGVGYFVLALVLITFSKLLLDQPVWQTAMGLDRRKVVPALGLAGLVGAVLLLAFSSLVLTVIYSGGFHDVTSILKDLLRKELAILLDLFVLSLLGAIVYTFVAELRSLVKIWQEFVLKWDSGTHPGRSAYESRYLAILQAGVIFVFSVFLRPSLIQCLFFFGIVNAAALVPLLAVALQKGRSGGLILLSTLAGVLAGYIFYPAAGYVNAVFMAALVSAIPTMMAVMFRRYRIRNNLEV